MPVFKHEELPIHAETDIVHARHLVRRSAAELGLSIVDTTKVVTAASELARNTLIYGKGGQMSVNLLQEEGRKGIRLTFEDQGPGIANIDLALRDGYTTGGGLGLGLSGAKRLSNEFHITSALGQGTKVTIARWK